MKGFLLLKKSKKLRKNWFFLIPIVLFFFLINLLTLDFDLKKQINALQVFSSPFNFSLKPYPMLRSVLGEKSINQEEIPPISAEAAVIIDDESKVLLYSKNSNLRFSTASTAKIMTALVALDNYNLEGVLTIKATIVEGVVVGFKKGEKVKFIDILYAMLLPSGNDAAIAIAQNYPGGESAFVVKMNEKAKALHIPNTHFSDTTGLMDEGDYTTAFDLALLSSVAMENKTLANIVSTREKIITSVDGNTYVLSNLNKLLGMHGVNGIKTGFTSEAEGVLTTATTQNGHKIIIVVMKSKDRFLDTLALLKTIDGNLDYVNFTPSTHR